MHHVADLLNEQHAHGIAVKIESPDEWVQAVEGDVPDVVDSIEGAIGEMVAGGIELGFDFLTEDFFV